MRIQPGEMIAGHPALAMRKLMKQGRKFGPTTSGNPQTTIAEILSIDLLAARAVFQELCKEGYIEPVLPHEGSQEEDEYWYTTIKGNALANATARKPITQQTADRLIEQFLSRVEQINTGNYAYQVKQVILFGSYLSERPTLGDIDLSLVIEPRYDDSEKQGSIIQERIEAALQQGRTFKNGMDQAFWPYSEVLLILKGRSPSLSLSDEHQEHVLSRSIPSKVLFDSNQSKNPTTLRAKRPNASKNGERGR